MTSETVTAPLGPGGRGNRGHCLRRLASRMCICLHLSAGKVLLQKQVQTDEGKHHLDGLGLLIGMLGGISVNHVLMK